MAVAVELNAIEKSFGRTRALKGISAGVEEGSICGIIGPNGSGKTTILRIILDIISPDNGSVVLFGTESGFPRNAQTGYLPEERGLYRKMTVRHQLDYLGRLKGLGKAEVRRRSDHWLERMGLPEVAGQKVESLSKGMAQKIQFVGAVLHNPRLLVLDEPFSGLDPVNMEVLRDVILEMRRAGHTILFSTHDMSMAERLCDSILMIYQGEKVLDGSLDEIQRIYGRDTVRFRLAEGDTHQADVQRLAQVEHAEIRNLGRYQEVRGLADPHAYVRRLVARFDLDFFEITPPSLHDIFVRIARPVAEVIPETERKS